MENLTENAVEITPAQIENVEINLDPTFLQASLKDLTEDPIYKNTFDHLNGLKERTAEQKIFIFQYKEEILRLKRNKSSIESKARSEAKKLNITVEEYLAREKSHTGGGRKAEYQFTQEDYDKYKAELLRKDLTTEEKLHWLEVKEEKLRLDKTIANKKCADKKKALIDNPVVVTAEVETAEVETAEVVTAEVVTAEVETAEVVTAEVETIVD
jgi:hypothetical protein